MSRIREWCSLELFLVCLFVWSRSSRQRGTKERTIVFPSPGFAIIWFQHSFASVSLISTTNIRISVAEINGEKHGILRGVLNWWVHYFIIAEAWRFCALRKLLAAYRSISKQKLLWWMIDRWLAIETRKRRGYTIVYPIKCTETLKSVWKNFGGKLYIRPMWGETFLRASFETNRNSMLEDRYDVVERCEGRPGK